MTEATKEIRTQLKALGISSRQVSVRYDRGYSIDVNIKDFSVNFETVKNIAQKYESIHRCEYSGEILSGGNTYVSVRYDWEAERDLKKTEEFRTLVVKIESRLNTLEASTGYEFLPGFVVSKNYNGNLYISSVPWKEGHDYTRYAGAEDIAFELYTAKLQKKIDFVDLN